MRVRTRAYYLYYAMGQYRCHPVLRSWCPTQCTKHSRRAPSAPCRRSIVGMPIGHIMSLSRDVCSRVCPAALRTGHGLLSLRLLSARLFCCVIKPKNDLVLAHYSTGVFRFMTAGRGAWREKAEEGASSCFRGEEVAWKRSGLGFTASPGIKSRI